MLGGFCNSTHMFMPALIVHEHMGGITNPAQLLVKTPTDFSAKTKSHPPDLAVFSSQEKPFLFPRYNFLA